MTRRIIENQSLRRTTALAVLMGTTALAGAAMAADQPPSGTTQVQEVIVTAQKRSESIQRVPMSIQALDSRKLEQLNVTEFNDYVKYLPSVSVFTEGPNTTAVYFRGVASGENGNHSGPQPSVGTYLDEIPITTILGTLDIHVYDVARVEALAGPQGTLYGASSESGTMRIITNKPSTSGFSAALDVQGNTVSHGDQGYVAEGYVNVPITSKAAIRLVAWDEHDAGYIDNVYGTRTFPSYKQYLLGLGDTDAQATAGATINNSKFVKKAFNPADTIGMRAALKIDLDDNWSITPGFIGQDQRNTGVFGYEPNVGYLQVQRFQPDTDHDRWGLATLTIQGKLSKMDVTYAGGYLMRKQDTASDYSDYSIFYDGVSAYGNSWVDNAGNPLANPSQEIYGHDKFTKESHELRIASPSTDRFRIIAGLFHQRQTHWIIQDYVINGFSDFYSVHYNVPGTIWLTDQMRIDRDRAIFGEASYDLTDHITMTGGVRFYDYDNGLKGFYGYGGNFSSHTGEAKCFTPVTGPGARPYRGAPCINLNKETRGSGETHKFNITYKFDSQRLAYFTYSTGFRPGGVNRSGDAGPYSADFLTNLEVGWKTSWMNHRLRFNGAVFQEDWDNFQFSFLGQNSLTIVANAGHAQVKGVETDVGFQVTPQLNLSAAATYVDAKLTQPYCALSADVAPCNNNVNFVLAKAGTQLPVTPKLKANVQARYTFDILGWNGHLQGAAVYQDKVYPGLRDQDNFGSYPGEPPLEANDFSSGLGVMHSWTTVDMSVGVEKNGLALELFAKNLLDEHGDVSRSTPCTTAICTATATSGGPGVAYDGTTPLPKPAIYAIPLQPRTIGVKLSKKF